MSRTCDRTPTRSSPGSEPGRCRATVAGRPRTSSCLADGSRRARPTDSKRLRHVELQLEHVRHTRQGQGAKGVVDLLGWQVVVLLAHPPIHEADERPDEEADDGLEPERIELAGHLESQQLRLDKLLEAPSRLAPSQRAALAARDGLEEPLAGA